MCWHVSRCVYGSVHQVSWQWKTLVDSDELWIILHLCVCLSVCLWVYVSVCLCVCLSVFVCAGVMAVENAGRQWWTMDHAASLVSVCLSVCLSVYVSVCVSVQVSWQWKTLVDNDELWIVLCQRLGWTPTHSTSPFEKSSWKRLYIDNIISLKRTVGPLVSHATSLLMALVSIGLGSRLCSNLLSFGRGYTGFRFWGGVGWKPGGLGTENP